MSLPSLRLTASLAALGAATAVLSAPATSARADEGMWTFDNVPLQKMKAAHGFAPDAAWLKKAQLATLRFPGGTGAFVSRDGLVITNHHVGRSAIAQVSSAQRDFIKDGFTAATRDQEIKVPGLELMMLVSSEDVTARVAASEAEMVQKGAIVSTLPAVERERWIRGLPNIARTWVDSSGPAARDVLNAYFAAIRAAGQTPGRNWDREVAA